jgi:hypothetical protein
VYASGLRNPVGLAYFPGTNTLWTAVNERDHQVTILFRISSRTNSTRQFMYKQDDERPG